MQTKQVLANCRFLNWKTNIFVLVRQCLKIIRNCKKRIKLVNRVQFCRLSIYFVWMLLHFLFFCALLGEYVKVLPPWSMLGKCLNLPFVTASLCTAFHHILGQPIMRSPLSFQLIACLAILLWNLRKVCFIQFHFLRETSTDVVLWSICDNILMC